MKKLIQLGSNKDNYLVRLGLMILKASIVLIGIFGIPSFLYFWITNYPMDAKAPFWFGVLCTSVIFYSLIGLICLFLGTVFSGGGGGKRGKGNSFQAGCVQWCPDCVTKKKSGGQAWCSP